MANQEDIFKKVISHAKEYGYVFQSSEIYDGLSAVYDYGQNGAELKKNIREYWWKAMVQLNENIVGIDAAIFMHPKTWKASGHVDAFNDPLIDSKQSNKRYRADVLVEDAMEKIEKKIDKDIAKAKKRFGDEFDEKQYRSTNPRVLKRQGEIDEIRSRLAKAMTDEDMPALKQLIVDLDIADPETGSREWTDVRQFNLMFSTQLGNIAGSEGKLYLRPETAQGIFVNFLNVQKTTRQKIPFGIAQIGKAFRNEIVARQFIFRMREFEQMEMQFFVRPGTEMKWYDYWKEQRLLWYKQLGFDESVLRIHNHEQLAHYANAALDLEFKFPFGTKELEGIHSRTDFDLARHQEYSGKKLQVYDHEKDRSYVPYVVETSVGLDRLFLALMTKCLVEEDVPDADGESSQRVVLKLPPALAPVKVAVLPLLKNKEELTDMAQDIFNQLRPYLPVQYDEKDAIGRRYRRQDAIGTPYCVTVDFESLEDNTVTLRDRDTLDQERIAISDLLARVRSATGMEEMLKALV